MREHYPRKEGDKLRWKYYREYNQFWLEINNPNRLYDSRPYVEVNSDEIVFHKYMNYTVEEYLDIFVKKSLVDKVADGDLPVEVLEDYF